MHCYECDRTGHGVIAIAICRRCGGAACRKHVASLTHPGAPGGLVGFSQPRLEHVCLRCLAGIPWSQPLSPPGQNTKEDRLPDARRAVHIAESLIRHQQQTLQRKRLHRWRVFRAWFGRLFATELAGETQEQPQVQPSVGSSQEG